MYTALFFYRVKGWNKGGCSEVHVLMFAQGCWATIIMSYMAKLILCICHFFLRTHVPQFEDLNEMQHCIQKQNRDEKKVRTQRAGKEN